MQERELGGPGAGVGFTCVWHWENPCPSLYLNFLILKMRKLDFRGPSSVNILQGKYLLYSLTLNSG